MVGVGGLGGEGGNGLVLEGDQTPPFVVQEGSNFDWLGCKKIDKSSLHYEKQKMCKYFFYSSI